MAQQDSVKMWEEKVKIPTYPVGKADKNPMFLEKRVYQGSSGKVYPLPFIEKISDEKIDKEYQIVYLENKYLKIEIMPELGGRIQRAYDKTNGYDFVYYNPEIKPALVGLAGPWIAGGIEFNWPQHHRPTTYSPVEYTLEENEDGSKTVWVSEIDRMYGTKGMAGLTLYPDKAYIEIKGQLYNKTKLPQTFLWWANPAVAVNDQYKSIFPPDVHAVFDHGKRDVSKFPIATGEYYKVDYSAGVDISKYKNIPVPTSYMAYHSDYNFVGGYDFGKEAGILHVANHHISPGKKQWTWGHGDFGQQWYQNLTDTGTGEYIELMTGVYTDNQPDFSWLEPYEEKTFTQYFMPYKKIGEVKNANIDILLNLELNDSEAQISVYTTAVRKKIKIQLKAEAKVYFEEIIDTTPQKAYQVETEIDPAIEDCQYKLIITNQEGKELISYSPAPEGILQTPEPAKAAKKPEAIQTNEELYLTALHLEQYRHATYNPDPYYLEGLKRDPADIRINNAYGRLLLRRGLFAESEKYFKKAINKLTARNPNPYNGEPYYNLGLSLKYQNKITEAFAAFHKAIWNGEWQDSGFYELAAIENERGKLQEALDYIEKSIIRNYNNSRARNLKTAILRQLKNYSKAENFARETLAIDPLDFAARSELYYIYTRQNQAVEAKDIKKELVELMNNKEHNYLELALEYGTVGLYKEGLAILELYIKYNKNNSVYPMIYYYAANYSLKLNKSDEAANYYKKAAAANSDYCFPNRLESILVLKSAINENPADAKAPYYLANLFYDKKQEKMAVELWEKSVEIDDSFPTVHRNLALAYYNKLEDIEKAKMFLEKAYNLNQDDARILFELDQLYKKIGLSHQKRLQFLKDKFEIVQKRDDLYTEFITLKNNNGNYEEALSLLAARKFHPWEGGEGKVTSQYVFANVELAKEKIKNGEYQNALVLLKKSKDYPTNLGEGKLPIAKENDIDYYLAISYRKLGKKAEAEKYFKKAAVGSDDLGDMMYYNDQPAHMILYQGLALQELGEEQEALSKFNQLYDYGEKHLFDEVEIDYFAVSLPDFLVFEADLKEKNKAHCRYLMGLGLIGLGEKDLARKEFALVKKIDLNHQGIKREYLSF